ncbi:MAG: hypothetical protein ABI612_17270 [Betaproteobacteria bacterium]
MVIIANSHLITDNIVNRQYHRMYFSVRVAVGVPHEACADLVREFTARSGGGNTEVLMVAARRVKRVSFGPGALSYELPAQTNAATHKSSIIGALNFAVTKSLPHITSSSGDVSQAWMAI